MKQFFFAFALLTTLSVFGATNTATTSTQATPTTEQQLEQYKKLNTTGEKVAALNRIFDTITLPAPIAVRKQITILLNNLYQQDEFDALKQLIIGHGLETALREVNKDLKALSYVSRPVGANSSELDKQAEAFNLISAITRRKEFADKHPYEVAAPIAEQFTKEWAGQIDGKFLEVLQHLVLDCPEHGIVTPAVNRCAIMQIIKNYNRAATASYTTAMIQGAPLSTVKNIVLFNPKLDVLSPKFTNVPADVMPHAATAYANRLTSNTKTIAHATRGILLNDIARIAAVYSTPWGITMQQAFDLGKNYFKQQHTRTDYDHIDDPTDNKVMHIHTPITLQNMAVVETAGYEFPKADDLYTKLQIDDAAVTHAQTLVVKLSNNAVQLGPDCFAWPFLEELSLRANDLIHIPASTFASCKTLKKLDLSRNPQLELHDDMFWGLENLVVLNLSNCGLTNINIEALRPLSSLKWLDISQNSIPAATKLALAAKFPHLKITE